MVSEYEYATIKDVEDFADVDYGALVDPFSDDTVEANISMGERELNVYTGQTFSGTIPDGIKSATILLAFRRLYNRMVWKGMMDRENPKREKIPIWDDDIINLVAAYVIKTIAPVDLLQLYNNEQVYY